MPAYKLDPEWVMSYLNMQEEKLAMELQPDQKDVVMNKIRELTLSIMYKQARRYLVYFESSEPEEEEKSARIM
ncbi:hypothetical protein [Brevibacillus nitrificans]|uniref:hypothetical protein n=1 Tax=Brevibacillus nitrificans TaxID=651560 RepID=UPI00286380C3|nr:hypothetical protein [Brevibacillus nitrificans]MDR7318567.1 hypothetical protein [Brevibacillus nitrificans]